MNQGKTSDPWYTVKFGLSVWKMDLLDQYEQPLIQLVSKVERQDGLQMVKRRLLSKFGKEEVAGILVRLE